MSGAPREVVAQLADGLQLLVTGHSGNCTASVFRGEWPSGNVISTTVANNVRVNTSDAGRPTVWFNSTVFHLPWPELLKVADFLVLDIPHAEAEAVLQRARGEA